VDLSRTQNQLEGVAAVSSTEVWAVGQYSQASQLRPFVERWNGQAWTAKGLPLQNYNDLLLDVTVIGKARWVVGRADPPFGGWNATLAELSCKR
jgi:hypothetical protein